MKKFLTYKFLIRFGLGVIFIANALTALLAPNEFVELIKNSFISNFLPISPEAFVRVIIGLNDLTVGLLFISGFAIRRVAIWAMIWLIGVMVVIANPFDILEHAGLLFMAFALFFNEKLVS